MREPQRQECCRSALRSEVFLANPLPGAEYMQNGEQSPENESWDHLQGGGGEKGSQAPSTFPRGAGAPVRTPC